MLITEEILLGVKSKNWSHELGLVRSAKWKSLISVIVEMEYLALTCSDFVNIC